jgi:hypothetical protein
MSDGRKTTLTNFFQIYKEELMVFTVNFTANRNYTKQRPTNFFLIFKVLLNNDIRENEKCLQYRRKSKVS